MTLRSDAGAATGLTRPRRVATSCIALAGLMAIGSAGCADPVKTSQRGAQELEAHRADPLLAVVPAGLTRVSSSERAAHVDSGLFHPVFPTTFVRTYTASSPGEDVLRAYDAVLAAAGARLVSSSCLVAIPSEEHVYGASSSGDQLTIRVVVAPSDTMAPVRYQVEVAKALPSPARGLRDCLHVRLAPSDYRPAYSGPRSDVELCALVPESLRRQIFDGALGTQRPGACVIKGRRGGRPVYLRLVDQRTSSIADLLGDVPPDTDPLATRIDSTSGAAVAAMLPRLTSGALTVESNDRTALDLVVRELLGSDAWSP